jgi:hypothetical protein
MKIKLIIINNNQQQLMKLYKKHPFFVNLFVELEFSGLNKNLYFVKIKSFQVKTISNNLSLKSIKNKKFFFFNFC